MGGNLAVYDVPAKERQNWRARRLELLCSFGAIVRHGSTEVVVDANSQGAWCGRDGHSLNFMFDGAA